MKKLQFTIIRIFALSCLFVIGVSGNTVSLDTSFNGTGYSIIQAVPSPLKAYITSSAVQPDGKIVFGGYTVNNGQPESFIVMRMNADGSPDTSFGNGGTRITTIDLSAESAKILIQPDGKILLCGTSYTVASEYNFTVIRYNTDGSLDTTFNGTGYSTQSFVGRSFDICRDMALQPDGKIVLAGKTAPVDGSPTLNFNFAVMRLNTNGSLDTTFNGSGMLSAGTQNPDEIAYSVILGANDKIIVGGTHKNGSLEDFLIMRFNADGTTDTSFGTGGATSTRVSSTFSNVITVMALQSNGKILAGGYGGMARYTADGILDSSFAANGITTDPNRVTAIRVIGGNKILVASRFIIQRYLENGAIDTKFRTSASVPNHFCDIYSINLQSDNKMLLAGSCNTNTDITKFAAFRFQETLTKRFLDFNGDERSNFSLFRPSTGQWLYLEVPLANQPVITQLGTSTDRPIPADFTGDGRTDIAVFRPSTGEWFILRSENSTFYSFPFGSPGDIPIADDFDGDQIADNGIFRPSLNLWYIQKSTGGFIAATFGSSGDKLVPSDYDGDFKADIAIYRPASGQWWIQRSSDGGIYAFTFGISSDKPVPGDYTGDGKTDAAFFRPSTGEWFILRSEDNSYFAYPWGLSDDLPTPGNYGGDRRFDAAVYRPSTNRWYVLTTGSGSIIQTYFGTAGDQPVPNYFVP